MNKFETPEIPESQINFAKAVAKAADDHGVESFTLTYEPDWSQRAVFPSSIYGTLTIHFSSKDGRGRPANNLSINYEATLKHSISETPESCS